MSVFEIVPLTANHNITTIVCNKINKRRRMEFLRRAIVFQKENTMKRIITVQDISCVGKCSLTVALPVISAMGVEAAILPTAVLSTHTAFKGFTFRDLTEDITPICDHWKKEKISFDAIYTGYLGSFEQLDLMKKMFADFGGRDVLVFVDYPGQTFEEKVKILKERDATKDLPAVKENRFINLPYAMWTSSPLNVDAAEYVRKGYEKFGLAPASDITPALTLPDSLQGKEYFVG